MAQVDLTDYKNIYLQTAKEYIDNMFSGYSKLSVNLQDKDAVNSIHISSHSLKSQSQVMKYTVIADLCANIEKISSDILNGIVNIDDKFIALLKDSLDKINLEIAKL